MNLFYKIIVLLNFHKYINSAGVYENCLYSNNNYSYSGQCRLHDDCQYIMNDTKYCDNSFICCADIYHAEGKQGLGGVRALINEFPHMALIGYEVDEDENKWRCSGSIITSIFILSAAHCNSELIPNSVLLGVNNYEMDYEQGQILRIIEIIDHPEYDFNLKLNDICLYRLNASIHFGLNIRLICLPEINLKNLSDVVATGWGATSLTSGMSQNLLKMQLNLWDKLKCNIKYNETIQMCAGSVQAIDTCSGDSGGPLQIKQRPSNNAPCSYTILGVTSHGKACLNRNRTYSIYTKVSSYLRWIKEIVWHGIMDCDFN